MFDAIASGSAHLSMTFVQIYRGDKSQPLIAALRTLGTENSATWLNWHILMPPGASRQQCHTAGL